MIACPRVNSNADQHTDDSFHWDSIRIPFEFYSDSISTNAKPLIPSSLLARHPGPPYCIINHYPSHPVSQIPNDPFVSHPWFFWNSEIQVFFRFYLCNTRRHSARTKPHSSSDFNFFPYRLFTVRCCRYGNSWLGSLGTVCTYLPR